MDPIFASFVLSASLPWLIAALAGFAVCFGTFAHQGSFDGSAAQDVLASQVIALTLALVANSVLPVGSISGVTDIYLINSANAPGTQTTRTAAQIYADLTAQLGFPPPTGFAWVLSICHGGTGTMTLAGGTGVTLSSVTAGSATSIATQTGREYVCTMTSPSTMTMVNIAILNL